MKKPIIDMTRRYCCTNSLGNMDWNDSVKNSKHKNGFVMAVFEHSRMNSLFNEMKDLGNSLIELIDKE